VVEYGQDNAMKDIDIRLVGNREELEQVFKIRELVFVREQNVQNE